MTIGNDTKNVDENCMKIGRKLYGLAQGHSLYVFDCVYIYDFIGSFL